MIDPFPEVIPVLEKVTGIRAFFSTRRGGFSTGTFSSLNLSHFSGDDPAKVEQNWKLVLRAQKLEQMTLTLPRLCHGTRIEEISTGARGPFENTDAIYTREENRVLAVTMGDCLAALIADPQTRCIAAVHAGWRGTRDNILGKILAHLFSTKACRSESTKVALGPCLSIRSLEISAEVADTLPAKHLHKDGSRFFFDLRGCNRAQAETAGVFPGFISEIPACTRTDSHRFFSYRRDGAVSGRMAACIALV